MAMRSTPEIPVSPDLIHVSAAGGAIFPLTDFDTGEVKRHNGSDIYRIPASPTIGDNLFEGATVLTTTRLEDVEPGTVLVADGACWVSFRTEVKEGGVKLPSGDKTRSRGSIVATVFVERLLPLEININELIAKARREQSKTPAKAPAPAGGASS